MKVCFCGLGSIGKRHLLNLSRVARELNINLELHALRKTGRALESGLSALIAKQAADESGLDSRYDIAFVTNPTALHFDTIKAMAGRTNHIFIEKPVFDGLARRAEELGLQPDGVYYVAGPMRYSGVIQKLAELAAEEPVYCARAICSSYLPDWRPGADYRQVYSARKALGGGVGIDLIHEWDYLVRLFGFPRKLYSLGGKYSRLEIDSADLAVYIAEYPDKAVELHLDYFGRLPRREIELFTQNGTITGDLMKNTISFTDGRGPIRFQEDDNELFLREMRFFIDKIRSGQSYNNIGHCVKLLSLALGKAAE
jgi:Predicted dehydrogenases and related proteins